MLIVEMITKFLFDEQLFYAQPTEIMESDPA